jgi:hypothetical protein
LRTINTEEVAYFSSTGGKYGTIQDLISAGLLDRRYAGEIDGYSYEVQVQELEKNYSAKATPVGNAGRYSYMSTSDAVVRYGAGPAGTPIGQSVRRSALGNRRLARAIRLAASGFETPTPLWHYRTTRLLFSLSAISSSEPFHERASCSQVTLE